MIAPFNRCVYPRYAAGYSGIDKTDTQGYFDGIATDHPELTVWSPQSLFGNCLSMQEFVLEFRLDTI